MSAINKPLDLVTYFPKEITLKILSSLDESEKSVCAEVSTGWYKFVLTNELHKVVNDVFKLMKMGGDFKESLHREIESTKHGAFENFTEKFAVKYSVKFPLSTSRLLKAKNFKKINLRSKFKVIFQNNLSLILTTRKVIKSCNQASDLNDLSPITIILFQSTLLCKRLNLMDEFRLLLEKNDLSTVGGKCNFTAMYRTSMKDHVDVDFMLTIASKLKEIDFKKYVLKDVFNALRDKKDW